MFEPGNENQPEDENVSCDDDNSEDKEGSCSISASPEGKVWFYVALFDNDDSSRNSYPVRVECDSLGDGDGGDGDGGGDLSEDSPGDGDADNTDVGDADGGGGDGGGCFPEDATVEVQGKGPTTMKALQVGDEILTSVGGNYETIYGFAHQDRNAVITDYLDIYTSAQESKPAPLKVTGEHLLAIPDGKFVAAKSLQVGDLLESGDATSAVVTEIKSAAKKGLYAPLTQSGTLIVNGIKTSCYITVQDDAPEYYKFAGGYSLFSHQFLSHFSLGPIRTLCAGVSAKFCGDDAIDQQNGYAWYVNIWFKMTDFFDQQSFFVQVLLLAAYFVLFGTVWMLETAFGASLAPLALVGMIAGFGLKRKVGQTEKTEKVA